MKEITGEVRKRRQFTEIRIRSVYDSSTKEFKQIWDYLKKCDQENGNNWDNKIVNEFYSLNSDYDKIKTYVEILLESPGTILLHLAKNGSKTLFSVNDIAAQLGQQLTIDSNANSLKIKPITIIFNHRCESSVSPSSDWIKTAEIRLCVNDESKFCDSDLVKQIVNEKKELDKFTDRQKDLAKKRSNPYENVKSAIFQSREAIKLASLDQLFHWKLSGEEDGVSRGKLNPLEPGCPKNNAYARQKPIFYFADICGGPGAHSEYLFWRKGFYNAKGFGFTMKKENERQGSQGGNFGDYSPEKFVASSYAFLDTYYGVKGDGNIYDPENLKYLETYVKEKTDGKGVHLVTADGAVDPNGRETIQEIIHKRIFVGEFIAALSLCRIDEGNFVCKLYDILTPFTVGLIYLMYAAFRKVSICKPVSVRPACSEQFLVCQGLTKFGATVIKNHLISINEAFELLPKGQTIIEVIPQKIIDGDYQFLNFIMNHNCSAIQKQISALKFYKECVVYPSKALINQDMARTEALFHWEIPSFHDRRLLEANKDINQLFKDLCAGFDIRRFRPLPPLVELSICDQLGQDQMILDEYVFQQLDGENEILLISDERGNIYIFEPHQTTIEKLRDSNVHDFPPKTILLVQKTKKLFNENHSIKILDAAVLAGDNVYGFPLSQRLKFAKKFAETATIRYRSYRIQLEVTPIAFISASDLQNVSDSRYLLKVIRIYRDQYYKIKTSSENYKNSIIFAPTMEEVSEDKTVSAFQNSMVSSAFKTEWIWLVNYVSNLEKTADEELYGVREPEYIL